MSTPSTPSASELNPYDQPPSFFERQSELVWAAGVFFLTVVLTVLAFPPSPTPEFAYAFAAPAAFWAYRRPAFKLFAWTVLGAQALAWTIVLGWLHHVTWLGLALLGPFVGVWVGSWFLAAWWVMPRMLGRPTMSRLLGLFGLAALWVVIEWTRTWLLGGFPWLPLAGSQWQRVSILQIAAYTGAGGVSFVLISMNLGFAAYAHRLLLEGRRGFNRRSQEFFAVLFLLLVCLSVHVTESVKRSQYTLPVARFAFVQPDIPQDVKWDPAKAQGILDTLNELTLRAASGKPDVILWPEATTPFALKGDEAVRAWTEDLVKRAEASLLLGSVAIERRGAPDEAWLNGAFVVTPQEGVQPRYYAKRHLVPFGEFVPFRPLLGWLDKFVPIGDDFTAGEDAAPLIVPTRYQTLALGTLICYEDIFPGMAREAVLAGADALVVMTNNAWFGQGGAAYQHAAHSVLRAVETRRPVLRVGNAGWSGWIDEFGNTRAVLTKGAGGRLSTQPKAEDATIYFRGTQTVAVSCDSRWVGKHTYYTLHAGWFELVSALLAIVAWAGLRKPFTAPVEITPPDVS